MDWLRKLVVLSFSLGIVLRLALLRLNCSRKIYDNIHFVSPLTDIKRGKHHGMFLYRSLKKKKKKKKKIKTKNVQWKRLCF